MDLSQPHAFCPLYILRQIVANRVRFMINIAVCIIAMKTQNILFGFFSFSRIFFSKNSYHLLSEGLISFALDRHFVHFHHITLI